MKILIDIPEESIRYANEIPNTYCKWLLSHNDIVRAVKLGTPIPDNATNGDVIKAMYPNGDFHSKETEGDWWRINHHGKVCYEVDFQDLWFDEEWWNAPYKKE